jgi:hypothetical protein
MRLLSRSWLTWALWFVGLAALCAAMLAGRQALD